MCDLRHDVHPRIVFGALLGVGQYCVSLVDDSRRCRVSTKIRVMPELLHQRAIAPTNDLDGRVAAYMKYFVIIAAVGLRTHTGISARSGRFFRHGPALNGKTMQ